MKNYVSIILLVSVFTFSVQAQSKLDSLSRQNELKIDILDFIALNAFEVSYERLTKDRSFGVSLFINSSDETNYVEKFAITPFYRLYIFNKENYGAKGYFAEVFTKIVFGETNISEDYFEAEMKEYFATNIGFSLGKKWVHKSGLALEYSLGLGRNLFAEESAPDITVRGGVSCGYRF
jgi:hypothetical protein